MSKDYYKILGVDKNATEEDVKKAYRRLAHQHHPDKAGGNEAKFKEINEAYQILSNKEKRQQYDQFGQVFGEGGGQGGPWGFGFGFDPSNINMEDLGGVGDIFDMFFEGMGVKKKRRTYRRGADLEMALEISLEESFHGTDKKIKIKTFDSCAKCGGLGHFSKEGFTQCSACGGRGEIKESRSTFFGSFSQVKTCSKCFGSGQIPNKICKDCGATGRLPTEKEMVVNIMSGVNNGQIIKMAKMGEAGEQGAEKGDLYVHIKIKPHAEFKREENDLFIRKELNLLDVLLGTKAKVKTISGEILEIDIPENYNLSEKFKIRGEGMPRLGGYGRGDLYIQFEVKTPKRMTTRAKKALEDFKNEL